MTTAAYTPYVKLVAYLVREKVLDPRKLSPTCQSLLRVRIESSETPEGVVDNVKLLRTFMEIAEPNPRASSAKCGKDTLDEIVANMGLPANKKLGELPKQIATQASIYLERNKSASRPTRGRGRR
jgi:hypothetical protein